MNMDLIERSCKGFTDYAGKVKGSRTQPQYPIKCEFRESLGRKFSGDMVDHEVVACWSAGGNPLGEVRDTITLDDDTSVANNYCDAVYRKIEAMLHVFFDD